MKMCAFCEEILKEIIIRRGHGEGTRHDKHRGTHAPFQVQYEVRIVAVGGAAAAAVRLVGALLRHGRGSLELAHSLDTVGVACLPRGKSGECNAVESRVSKLCASELQLGK